VRRIDAAFNSSKSGAEAPHPIEDMASGYFGLRGAKR
jgi:hypothetical protein